MKTKIEITEQGDPIEAISAAITIAKVLNLEFQVVQFEFGFSLPVRADSVLTDIVKIYELTKSNRLLAKEMNDLNHKIAQYQK